MSIDSAERTFGLHEEFERHSYSYDLDTTQVDILCGEFLESQEKVPEGQFGCYVIKGDSKFSDLGRFVESTVFKKTFNNDPETMAKEYGPYEGASTFFVVIDQEQRKPIGVMRTIENSSAGLKSLVDVREPLGIVPEDVFEAYAIDPDKCIDVGTLAVMPEYRKRASTPTLLMYRTLYVTVLDNPRIDHVISIIDERAEKLLKDYKFPFTPVLDTDSFSYLDSLRSRFLYARTSEYRAQTRYWHRRFIEEAAAGNDEDGMKQFLADILRQLAIDGIGVDESLGFDPENTKL